MTDKRIFNVQKLFFLVVNAKDNIKGTLHLIILQTLWECLFWMSSKPCETTKQ